MAALPPGIWELVSRIASVLTALPREGFSLMPSLSCRRESVFYKDLFTCRALLPFPSCSLSISAYRFYPCLSFSILWLSFFACNVSVCFIPTYYLQVLVSFYVPLVSVVIIETSCKAFGFHDDCELWQVILLFYPFVFLCRVKY